MCAGVAETAVGLKDFIPLFSVTAGVVVGGLIGFFNTSHVEKRKQATESRRLALAFQGEIRALVEIIGKRKYLENIEWVFKEMERTGEKYQFKLQVRRNYFLVFENNVGNIGLLPCPLPALIAQFYVQANSVLEDIESHRDGTFDELGVMDLIFSLQTLHSLLQDTVRIGENIIEETDTIYPSKTR